MTKVVEVIPSASIRGRSKRRLSALRVLLAASAAAAMLASLPTPAEAQRGYRYYSSPYYGFPGFGSSYAPRRARPAVQSSKPEAQKDVGFGELPKGPLQIVVSINSQRVTLFANGERVAQGPVSTGVPGHPTPTGVFSVIEKDRHHRSNIYAGAPMPYMQRITWSGIALHEGALPGHPASHGCIRLSNEFARKLWPTTRLGARVIVSRTELEPTGFAHAKLFAPRSKPAAVAQLDRPIQLAQNETATATDATPAHADAAPAAVADDTRPFEAAKPSEAAEGDAKPATDNSVAGSEVSPAPTEATQTAEPATDKPAEATGTIDPPQPAAAPALELRRAVEAPQPAAPPPAVAAPTSSEPAKPALELNDPPKPVAPRIKNADQPKKPTGQIAVFVSRKEKKIFIRQGFTPIFEMPIVIDQPEHPLGTHVFTALGTTDGDGMRWNLITVPNDVSRPPEPTRNSRRRGQAPAVAPAPISHRAPSTAAEALDRIEFPQQAVDLIAERLTPGSSLVVSDEGLGRETGRGTEFIVLTR